MEDGILAALSARAALSYQVSALCFLFCGGVLIDWPPQCAVRRGLGSVPPLQMAAGVRRTLTLSLRVMKHTLHSVGYLA